MSAWRFPVHTCGLFLTHNEHRDYYEPLERFVQERASTFASDEARQRCLDTDEYWELQWYPHTPVSSYCVAAPTLDEVLAYALVVEQVSLAEERQEVTP